MPDLPILALMLVVYSGSDLRAVTSQTTDTAGPMTRVACEAARAPKVDTSVNKYECRVMPSLTTHRVP
jgi:hypothetical protein